MGIIKDPEYERRLAVRRSKLLHAKTQVAALTGWDEGHLDESEGVPVLIIDGEQLGRLVEALLRSRGRKATPLQANGEQGSTD